MDWIEIIRGAATGGLIGWFAWDAIHDQGKRESTVVALIAAITILVTNIIQG